MAATKKPAPAKTGEAVKPVTDKARIKRILDGLQQVYGGTTTALDFRNPFELLIAVMLSAQTTDVYVNKVTPGLFARYPDARAMAGADVAEVTQLIKGVSFYPTKAKNVIATSRILVEQYGGEVPGDWDALVAMPGVGRKTANVVVATAFHQPAIAVDTHVFRVSNRLGLATATTPEETERQLQQAIPRDLWSEAHHWLIWHGRKICKAPTPKCDICFLTADCRYFQTLATPKPAAKPKAAAKAKIADGSATSPKTARTHKAAASRAAKPETPAPPKPRRQAP
jgi:endonuclease-3